ncbi:EamA family transporter [Haematospirillum sp. 15-248]|uniref:DMT family transporter n=1 Tax=Haematospirillum sp. 15-248 TaxID=2723107 RepID=UPI0014391A08|nr:EamA family transporter [Haematospirillum sp. 15-248]NKD88327.1 EamA family transporter [Haematospirillum sp. 15-248]
MVAAALNGMRGSFNHVGFIERKSHHPISFLNFFSAALTLLNFCSSQKIQSELVSLQTLAPKFMISSFLGIFCLYFFETWASKEAHIPLVSFLTYAAGGILSSVFLKEKIGLMKMLAFAAILPSVYFIIAHEVGISGSMTGIILALLGGLGCALFIFASKLLKIGSGLAHLVWLFGFGSLYLTIPYAMKGFSIPSPPVAIAILGLVIFPTIGDFYFTTKAIQHGNASSVQIIESSAPLFATLFAIVFFGESLGVADWLGALMYNDKSSSHPETRTRDFAGTHILSMIPKLDKFRFNLGSGLKK